MKRNILEVILIFIAFILIAFLIWNHFNYLSEKTILKNEYCYNAIKLTYTDNSITTIMYMTSGNPVIYIDTLYIENNKVTKYVRENHFSSINKARRDYDWSIKHSTMDPNTFSINKNVITYIDNNPEFYTESGQKIEYIDIKEHIKKLEEELPKLYPNFSRVY